MPCFEVRYSPIIEPIHAIPTFIFKQDIKVGKDEGITSFVSSWIFVAPIERNSMILLCSQAKNPFSIVIIVTIIVIIIAIKTIDLTPLPNHTIIIGPNAILGKLLSTIIYGSSIFRKFSDHHRQSAIALPSAVAIINPTKVSYRVVPTCSQRLPLTARFLIVEIIREANSLKTSL